MTSLGWGGIERSALLLLNFQVSPMPRYLLSVGWMYLECVYANYMGVETLSWCPSETPQLGRGRMLGSPSPQVARLRAWLGLPFSAPHFDSLLLGTWLRLHIMIATFHPR
jgi:hypothetical protein